MRVAAAAILGAVVAAALSAAAYQWRWSTSIEPSATGFIAESGTILVTLAGAILGGVGAAWGTMPRRSFFVVLGLFILAVAGNLVWPRSRLVPSRSFVLLQIAFPLGSLVVGRVLGWLVGVRGPKRSTATTAD